MKLPEIGIISLRERSINGRPIFQESVKKRSSRVLEGEDRHAQRELSDERGRHTH